MIKKNPKLMSSIEVTMLADKVLRQNGRLTGREWASKMLIEEPMSSEHIFTQKVGLVLSEDEVDEICKAKTQSERINLYKKLVHISSLLTVNDNWGSIMRRRVSKVTPNKPVWGGTMNGYTRSPGLADRVKYTRLVMSRNRNCSKQFSESVAVMCRFYGKKHEVLMNKLRLYTAQAMGASIAPTLNQLSIMG